MNITKIYLVTNCYGDPNKVYIGKTKNDREYKHKKRFGNDIIYTYIDQVDSLDKEYWKFLESYWIEQFRQWGFDIQNKNIGGGGPTNHSLLTKEKISQSLKGRKYSEESKLKMSLSKKGISKPKDFGVKISNSLTGYKHSINSRELMSLSRKGIPKPEGFGDVISNLKKGLKNNNISKSLLKPILQYDLDGNFIREWDSAKEYADKYKLTNSSAITSCLKNKAPSAYNSLWKYKTDNYDLKISPHKKNNEKMSIIQYDLEGNFIKEWESILEAANYLKIKQQGICNNLKNRVKHAYGFIWKYNN